MEIPLKSEVAPTVSATKKVEQFEPTTAKSETKETLKQSFENLVDMGGGKDPGDSGDAQSAKKDDGGLLTKILGGGDKKDKPPDLSPGFPPRFPLSAWR